MFVCSYVQFLVDERYSHVGGDWRLGQQRYPAVHILAAGHFTVVRWAVLATDSPHQGPPDHSIPWLWAAELLTQHERQCWPFPTTWHHRQRDSGQSEKSSQKFFITQSNNL